MIVTLPCDARRRERMVDGAVTSTPFAAGRGAGASDFACVSAFCSSWGTKPESTRKTRALRASPFAAGCLELGGPSIESPMDRLRLTTTRGASCVPWCLGANAASAACLAWLISDAVDSSLERAMASDMDRSMLVLRLMDSALSRHEDKTLAFRSQYSAKLEARVGARQV